MSKVKAVGTRAVLSRRLLSFAADRSIETREFDRRVAALPPTTPGHASMRAALAAAKAWETALLWVAWRLRPRASIDA